MPEQKHKIGKTSINSQLMCDVNSQKYDVAIKPFIKSIIIYKNQIKGTRQPVPGSSNIKRMYCLFGKKQLSMISTFKVSQVNVVSDI